MTKEREVHGEKVVEGEEEEQEEAEADERKEESYTCTGPRIPGCCIAAALGSPPFSFWTQVFESCLPARGDWSTSMGAASDDVSETQSSWQTGEPDDRFRYGGKTSSCHLVRVGMKGLSSRESGLTGLDDERDDWLSKRVEKAYQTYSEAS
ncbi:unnamed protein product [Protopolystoma xenopodis]|uniref:Uncharacterized protein n=1 Tax=Protopolystoma xenopodis TaxID=117903 RepID=A0A448X909_9PLAT|nr:unnamed protein product [Protopolystoma xenopodis]